MVWAYYDESGEYGVDGKLLNMSIGGCVSRREKWASLDTAWRALLEKEGLGSFHMTDFQAWKAPYNFSLANGDRDKDKHNRILNGLLELMLEHIEGFYGYASVSQYEGRELNHRNTLEDCIGGAVKDVALRIWCDYEEAINLVFAKQEHFPSGWVDKYVDFYEYGEAKSRVKSVCHIPASDLPALQAADIVAYEIARAQREGRPERYPFLKLVAGAKARGIPFSLTWGPMRSKRLNLSGSGISWG